MKKYPFFIFLFAVYPSLALLTWNFREVDANRVVRPLLFSILVASIIFVISLLLIKSLPKAILTSTIFILFFFSFGYLSLFVEGSKFASVLGLGSSQYFDEEYTLLKDQSINVGINRPYGKKTTKPGNCP